MKVLDAPGGGAGGELDLDGPDGGGSVAVDVVADLVARFDLLVGELAALGDRRFVTLAARWEQRLEADRLVAVARLAGSSGDARSDRRRARAHLSVGGRGGGRSGRSVNRDARRAAALAANRRLAEQAERGEVSGDGIDALSKAADQSTGEIPVDLLNMVGGLDPDQAARVVEEYLEERTSAAGANAKYEQQMRARRVRLYTVPASGSDPVLAGVGIEGPNALIDRIWALINAHADAAYRDAGGRDRSADHHVSLPHRRFDAALGFFTGNGEKVGNVGGRPSVVVTVGVGDLTGNGDRWAARQVGSGPISDELMADYVANGDLSLLFEGADGRPLWLGRLRRHASAAQFLALVVRDRGCVLCGAAFQRCQAHHVIPWHAPAKGRTNLDNLALLCAACHRRLHDAKRTLHRKQSQAGCAVWATRPVAEAELPPPTPIQRE
ncbi:MAG: HNH endonuclease [Acidimicrobiia bacterium]|nr:HNH endonuclease [Acidimicrobiia bacterium]